MKQFTRSFCVLIVVLMMAAPAFAQGYGTPIEEYRIQKWREIWPDKDCYACKEPVIIGTVYVTSGDCCTEDCTIYYKKMPVQPIEEIWNIRP